MDVFMVFGWIISYLMIGVFIVSLICGGSDDTPFWFVLVWPIIMACLLVAFILWIPCKVGEIIRDWWDSRHS